MTERAKASDEVARKATIVTSRNQKQALRKHIVSASSKWQFRLCLAQDKVSGIKQMGFTELKSFGNRLAVQCLFRNLSISFGFKF